MCRAYVPIFLDWLQVTEELNAQEKGRLIDAIVAYAAGEDWQEQIKGNERYLFPAFRRQIDRENEISNIRSESRTGKTKDNKTEQKKETITKPDKISNNNNNNNENKNDNENKNKDTEKRAREEKLPNGFERFWEVYPRKMAKAEAVKAFEKIKPDAMLIETMVKAVLKQRLSAQWKEDGGKYIPMPSTWLNQHRWEDEMPSGSTLKTVNAAKYDQRDYTEEELDDATSRLMAEAAAM